MPIGESEATILPASSTPAGNLEVLPREIRDEIYGYVLGTTDPNDLVRGFSVPLALQIDSFGTTRLHWDEMYPSSIIKLSKRIRQEAMEFLYSKGVFRIHGPSTNTKDTLFMDRIMNVKLPSYLSLEQRLKVTSLFAGTQVLRGTFAEEYDVYHVEKQIMEPPMIEAVKQLISFKTVAVQIYFGLPYTWMDEQDTRVNALVHDLRRALEPALGPSTEQSLEEKGQERSTRYDIALVFHPRDYVSRKTQAAEEESEIQKKTM